MQVVAGGEGRSGPRAEAEFLAFQIAQLLIDRQGGRAAGFRFVGLIRLDRDRRTPTAAAAGNDPLVPKPQNPKTP